jgi:glucosylglycerate synthase
MKRARLGIVKYFPRFKSVIVNSDGGSIDDTRKAIKRSDGFSELNTISINHQFHPPLRKFKNQPIRI